VVSAIAATAAHPSIAFEAIGPAKAKALLGASDQNRNVRIQRVDRYARDMRAGEWLMTGEPIQIAPDGSMHNGQHRMLAVIASGVTITFPVMRDVPFEYQAVADSGAARTFSDVLKLQFGEMDASTLGSMVRLVHLYRRSGIIGIRGGSATVPSINELIRTYHQEAGLRDSIPTGRAVGRVQLATPRGPAGVLHYLFAENDPDEVDSFFGPLVTGEMLTTGDPIFALRRNLIKVHARAGRPNPVVICALYVKAFNYWREGRQVGYISWKPYGHSPEDFPRILTAAEIAGSG
jgi:hypothetical protein